MTKLSRKTTTNPGVATVPEMEFFTSYVSRDIEGRSDMDIFDFARKTKKNVLIEGPTGPGKSSAVLAYAAKEKRPFYAIPSNIGIEPSQLFGKFIPDGEGGWIWCDGPVTSIIRHGGVLLLNEVNFMPERVATVLFGLLDKRRSITLLDHKSEVIEAHDDLLIVADMNPDYEGTRPLNKAFRNRFAVQLWWDYNPEVEKKLVTSTSLIDLASRVRAEAAKGLYETPVSTNMLMEFEEIAKSLDVDFAMANFLNHFNSDEKGPIKQLLETFKVNITDDLNPPVVEDADVDVAEEDDDDPFRSAYPDGHPIWEERENAEPGYVDPEWGVFGEDWGWPDDEDE